MSWPSSSSQVVVAGRREVGGPGFDRFSHRHCDRAVLEKGLFVVEDVVDKHVGAFFLQQADVFGEGSFAVEGRGKLEFGAGRKVVDDLSHRPSLVRGFGGVRLFFEHRHRGGLGETFVAEARQIGAFHIICRFRRDRIAFLVLAGLVEGVGEDADGDAAPVDPWVGFASRLRPQLRIALRDNRPRRAGGSHDGREHRGHAFNPRHRRDRVQAPGRNRNRDPLVASAGGDQLGAGFAQIIARRKRAAVEAHVGKDTAALARKAARRKAERSRLLVRRGAPQGRRRQLGEPGRELSRGTHRRRWAGQRSDRDRQEEDREAAPPPGRAVHARHLNHRIDWSPSFLKHSWTAIRAPRLPLDPCYGPRVRSD